MKNRSKIEKFIIIQKIEKVKELIAYNELNFSEIAFNLKYSSASHLAKQFKKITACTLSEYKKTKTEERNTIDNLL
ncbi:MAG TPA: AraC family transcriptional regulator [Flavobacteriaceae bacterium]|nr:AraC family transcriptional regulator [Flavobacteriaceae bacterium]HIP26498.1 AraC family transcriptional regulator [Flavobacteriaceae bacterium]